MNKIYKFLAYISPFFIIKNLINSKIIFPFYHIVSDTDVLHIKYLYRVKNVDEFINDLNFLLKHYIPISINDLYENIYNDKAIPSNAFLLTFDDGFREIYNIVAPILKNKGIPATFFLSTDFIDNKSLFYRCKINLILDRIKNSRYLTSTSEDKIKNVLIENNAFNENIIKSIRRIGYHNKELLGEVSKILNYNFISYLNKYQPYLTSKQIKKLLDDGFSIGAHSCDHPPYHLLSLSEQIKQTRESINVLRNKFGITHNFFAFPFNDNGVSNKFFSKVKGLVDISFGTGGFRGETKYNHFQRIPMEIQKLNAKTIIKMFILEKKLKTSIKKTYKRMY